SQAIAGRPEWAYDLTIKKNTVAIVTDGTAVLGLGDIGPEAALPVMEGKAMLFKTMAGVDAFPICLATRDTEEIIRTVRLIAPPFGGINLEDIAAPRCFVIESRLRAELDIPVFHDDQHGTAVVATAGLINALRVVGKKMEDIRVVVCGLGAAGTAIIHLLIAAGCRRIVGCDREGILYQGRRSAMSPHKETLAAITNPEGIRGGLHRALEGADVFIGVSRGGILKRRDVATMAKDPIVFAMANPDPEIAPEEAEKVARIVATGRSDYHNQINNVLCFPGLFRALLDCRVKDINISILLAAAQAIAGAGADHELSEDYIVPSVFNPRLPEAVAAAVRRAAMATGTARTVPPYFAA
ncbi:MAG: NADP-dependent malic enzyme, partial [Syntrophales bacterium]|nr:NADP-dependent malic enzyme [Syntrophales bacterium]